MAAPTITYYRNHDSSDTTSAEERTTEFSTAEALGFAVPGGKAFSEWNSARDGSGMSYQPGDSTGGSYDVVYAIWSDIPSTDYLVTDTELTDVADAIRTKGGTSAALEWPQGYVDAIGAISGGGGTEKTIEVVLTSPRHASSALDPACILYEADSPSEQGLTPIGSISSPTGSTTVTITKPLLLAVFQSSDYISPGYGNGLYEVYPINASVLDSGQAFFVCGDGYAYVNSVDYDD